VVLFGGQGSRAMLDIADKLHDVPLILMCGHNQALARGLQAQPAQAPRIIVGYTTEVEKYLRLGDFFIGKPGPGSLSEALHCGLPVIVTRNAWTLPQERYNTDWVREQRVGLVLNSFAGVRAAVATLRAQLPQFLAQVRRMDNRALFELPQILAGIHRDARCAQGGSAALAQVERPMPAANDDLAAGVQAS
jgi:UDP-N-acetylglucosamine:LPS N-acetylglucosamine transferase